MTVPLFETFTVTNSGLVTSLVVPAPVGLVEDDLILITVSLDGVDGNPQITGFARFAEASQGAVEHAVFIKRATDSEPPTYTITWTGNERVRAHVVRVSGCPTTDTALDQVNVTGATATGASGTSVAVPAITSTVIDTLAFAIITVDGTGVQSGDGLTTPNGYVDEGTADNNGPGGAGQMLATKDLPSIGSSLSPTFGWTNSQEHVTNQFNLIGISDGTIETKTFTLDAVLEKVFTKTFTMDAILKKLGITKTFTLDAVLAIAGPVVPPSDIRKNILDAMPYKTIPKHMIRTKKVVRAPIPVEVSLEIHGSLFEKLTIKLKLSGKLHTALTTPLKIKSKVTETIRASLGVKSNLDANVTKDLRVEGKQSHKNYIKMLKEYLKIMDAEED